MLRKADALTYLNNFLQQNDDLLEIAFPDENDFYEIDDHAEDSEIIKTIQNIFNKSGRNFIDQNLANEMMEIQKHKIGTYLYHTWTFSTWSEHL